MNMTNKTHLTAITRNRPSAPMKWLAANDRIKGRALDYGCGKGYDAEEYDMESFDPHYEPVMPSGKFDTIVCVYVLNTIESQTERLAVLTDIHNRLAPGGKSYIVVRNDKRALCGTTRKGTWQGLIILRLPVVHSCAGYTIYALLPYDRINSAVMEVRTDG